MAKTAPKLSTRNNYPLMINFLTFKNIVAMKIKHLFFLLPTFFLFSCASDSAEVKSDKKEEAVKTTKEDTITEKVSEKRNIVKAVFKSIDCKENSCPCNGCVYTFESAEKGTQSFKFNSLDKGLKQNLTVKDKDGKLVPNPSFLGKSFEIEYSDYTCSHKNCDKAEENLKRIFSLKETPLQEKEQKDEVIDFTGTVISNNGGHEGIWYATIKVNSGKLKGQQVDAWFQTGLFTSGEGSFRHINNTELMYGIPLNAITPEGKLDVKGKLHYTTCTFDSQEAINPTYKKKAYRIKEISNAK